MSTISNRFYVTALEDGTTLHGNLASDKSLTQAWDGNSAIPDWSQQENQPTIYLTLLSGTTLVAPSFSSGDIKWYYNGQLITFGENNVSTNPAGKFMLATKSVSYLDQTQNTMPALKIISNIASGNNVDVDTITFKGKYITSSGSVEFSCDTQIRISVITGNGNLGVINFVGGFSDITQPNQTITMYGVLYGASTGSPVSGVTTKWYINDSQESVDGRSIEVDGTTYQNAFQLNEGDVVDHATIRCEFYGTGNNLLYTAYAGVDDMQDPEFMYIQYNGNNGNAASLRKNQSAEFTIWVGRREDPSVIGGANTPTYNTIKVQLLDGDGLVIGGANDSSRTVLSQFDVTLTDADIDGYRTLGMTNGKALVRVPYELVASSMYGKKNLSAIVFASSSI